MTNSQFNENDLGVVAAVSSDGAKTSVNIDRCSISGNAEGVLAGNFLTNGGLQTITISNSLVSENTNRGITAAVSGVCFVTFTTIASNFTGLAVQGGFIVSHGSNRLANNTSDGAFTSTVPQQ